MTTLSHYKKSLIEKLSTHSDTPDFDADILFMHVLQKTRTQLLLDKETELTPAEIAALDAVSARRNLGEPIAYIVGHQPFWTMDLTVTRDTLIPRPETECLIEWVINTFKNSDNLSAVDLGTGTGAIAIALALEKKSWHITATDQSPAALTVAKHNAKKNHANPIVFYEGNWCDALPSQQYDIIISNPPYVAENDAHLAKLHYEPISALVSGKQGLDDIEKIASQAPHYLQPQGTLIIEHGYDQAEAVHAIFEKNNFTHIKNHRDLSNVPRFTTGQKT